MLRNYLRTAWRNLIRSRAYTLINLLGLALGMASCLLIVLYVQHELAYDSFHEQKDRIYRVSSDMSMGGNQDHYAMAGMAVGPTLAELYPEVDTFTRFLYSSNRRTLRFADQVFKEERIFLADAQVFEVFSYPLTLGDPQTALQRPNTMVLTESLARKYFSDEDPMGERIQVDQSFYEVTGVMRDLPDNSDFRFQALLSMSTLPDPMAQAFSQDWGRVIFYTYLLFDRVESVSGFDQKLADFVDDRVLPFWEENGVTGSMTYHLTPLTELHFRTDMNYDTPKGNASYLYIFSLVAVFILLIACFNYINLAIAQSARRSVEVGIRKATGASRGQLLGQFLGESFLLSFLALILAVLLVELALPVFNQIAGKSFSSLEVFSLPMVASMMGITLLTGLAAGSYPAIFLARLKPVTVLKGQLSLGGRHWLRRTLVVIQFSISIALIVGTLVIQDQMHFLQDRDLGFRQDQMLVVEVPFDSASQAGLPALRQQLLQHPAVKSVAAARNGLPGEDPGSLLMRIEQDGQLREDQFSIIFVDDRYFETLGIEVTQGRAFDPEQSTDPQQAFMVNETFVQKIGWQDPLGKRMQWGLMANNQAANDGKVIGVVKDFHYTSLHNPIEPLVLLYAPQGLNRLLVELEGDKVQAGLSYVEGIWRERANNQPFDYFFLDQMFAEQYAEEGRLMQLFTYFSLLTILIACMGLFGLASFITKQRTKEIGIRKVLGAGRSQILFLLVKDFTILVLVAVLIASAGAWLGLTKWLSGFAFRADMPLWAYLLAGTVALLMTVLATSYHSLRVSRANPADALRHE